MARYAISEEGVDALRSLGTNLQGAMNDILVSSNSLFQTINGLEDGLGVYYEEILRLVQQVVHIIKDAKEGEDGTDFLTQNYIPKLIGVIEQLYGLDGSSDEDDEPPQKVKVLRR